MSRQHSENYDVKRHSENGIRDKMKAWQNCSKTCGNKPRYNEPGYYEIPAIMN